MENFNKLIIIESDERDNEIIEMFKDWDNIVTILITDIRNKYNMDNSYLKQCTIFQKWILNNGVYLKNNHSAIFMR